MDMLHDKWYKVVPCGKRSFAVTEVRTEPPVTYNSSICIVFNKTFKVATENSPPALVFPSGSNL